MNTAVNTLGTASQASVAGNQVNKTMHAQGTTSFGQPSHISPGLGAMHTNTNVAHSHPNQQHHYSMNVPNAAGHYMNQNLGQIPASNHPVANASSTAAGQGYNLQKNASNYLSNYQPNLAHQQNQSTGTPVSQPLPSSLSSQTNVNNVDATSGNSEQRHAENSQSNGTSEVKSAQKIESISSPLNAKEKTVQPAPVPELPQVKEKSPAPAQTTTQQVQSDAAETPDSITTSVQTPSSDAKASPTNSSVIPQTETSSTASLPTNANLTNQKENSEPKKGECIESEPEPKKPEVEENSKPVQQTEKLEEVPVESNEEDKVENSSSPVTAESNITEEKSVPKEKGGPKDESTPKQVNSTTENTIKTPSRKTKSHSNKPDESTKAPKEAKVTAPKILSTSKTKRRRIRTQPYQSPLPEVELISKISSLTPRTPRNSDDKLIVFYKNEFLAVRNAEGSFYLCQAVQNIYKSSSKIKIRWLSQDKSDKTGEIYTPDFYDLTDFDCILTNLSLNRIEKGKFRLPPSENERTLSILNRSLAVEKGEVSSPSLTEEHPDGLDLSLYRDEDQLKKRKAKKRKAGRKPSNIRNTEKRTPTKKSPEAPKVRKVPLLAKTSGKITVPKKTEQLIKKSSESKKSETSLNRASGRGKRKVETNLSPVVDQKKAKVLAKIGKSSSIAVSKTVQSSTKNVKSGNKTTSSSKKTPHVKTSLNSSVKPTPRNARRSTRK